MDTFDYKKYLKENRLNESPYDDDSGLTVGQLIQKLSQMDPNLKIGIFQDSSDSFIEIEGVELGVEEGYAILK